MFTFLSTTTIFCFILQVRSVRGRLKNLGMEVSPCVLDLLSKTVNSWGDVSDVILRDIDCDDADDFCSEISRELFLFGEAGPASESLHPLDEQDLHAARHFSDIYILIEMLSIPCLAVEASQTFERAVARGAITAKSVAVVLEKRLAQKENSNTRFIVESFQPGDSVIDGETNESLRVPRDDFTSIVGLAETLALSRDPRVRGFVKMLYPLLFKGYASESYRGRMLKRLVDRVSSSAENNREVDMDLEILVMLIGDEQEIIRPVLIMMRDVAELANVDRAALWHQLCATEEESIRIREESKVEIANMMKEKTALSQKLSESDAMNIRLKVYDSGLPMYIAHNS